MKILGWLFETKVNMDNIVKKKATDRNGALEDGENG